MARVGVVLRHHIYVVGTCECERTIEKSLIWSSKARIAKQLVPATAGSTSCQGEMGAPNVRTSR